MGTGPHPQAPSWCPRTPCVIPWGEARESSGQHPGVTYSTPHTLLGLGTPRSGIFDECLTGPWFPWLHVFLGLSHLNTWPQFFTLKSIRGQSKLRLSRKHFFLFCCRN